MRQRKKICCQKGKAGFRKGRATLNNIYILNYLVRRAKTGKKKLYSILLVDLKAASTRWTEKYYGRL